jgi:hypothetical protein
MKQLASLVIALSVFDLAHDPKRVVVEACNEVRCERFVLDRDKVESEESLNFIAEKIASQFETR